MFADSHYALDALPRSVGKSYLCRLSQLSQCQEQTKSFTTLDSQLCDDARLSNESTSDSCDICTAKK